MQGYGRMRVSTGIEYNAVQVVKIGLLNGVNQCTLVIGLYEPYLTAQLIRLGLNHLR